MKAWFWRVTELPLTVALYGWLRLVFATVRFEREGEPVPGPAVYVSWHRHLVVLSPHHGSYRRWMMTSPAPYLGAVRRLARWVGLELAIGASGEGGAAARDILEAALRRGESVTIAVDGPHGPAFEAKRGCLVLAERTGAPIVPVAYVTKRGRTVRRRWDKMRWVSFFDVLTIRYGAPLAPASEGTPLTAADVARALDALDPDIARERS